MENFSKLLTSIAAVFSAVAWPFLILLLAYIFKTELKGVLVEISLVVKKVNKAAFAGISFEVERIAEQEATANSGKSGQITPRQIEAATRIKIQANNIAPQAIFDELDKLGLQYDAARRTLPPGAERTRVMASIVIKMRSLAPSAAGNLEFYKNSDLPGLRLAAVAIMQMVPETADLDWLLERFSSEQPFIFYQSALALERLSNFASDMQEKMKIVDAASKALQTTKKFKGVPDQNTVTILEGIIQK